MLIALASFVLAGCGAPASKLDTSYGKTYGTPGLKSVNGTSVLVELFETAGHKVSTVSRFSPRLDKVDTIVWFPDDFEPPSARHRKYLEEWLQEDTERRRTVIYVGRDYDAAAEYWRQAVPVAKPEHVAEYHRKRAEAISDWNTERMQIPGDTYARWFMLKSGKPLTTATALEGPWADGIDPKKCNIKLATRLDVPVVADRPAGDVQSLPDFETLLSTNQEPIVIRATSGSWNRGQVIVVANGSFLLNLPLINKEHRKLAGQLIDECQGSEVAFVESEAGGPPIRNREESPTLRTGFEMLTVWPLNVILLHTIGWLLLMCVCLYPIFGRPRKLYGALNYGARRMSSPLAHALLAVPTHDPSEDAPESTGDFGRHLAALGEMLSLTGNRQYAEEKLRYYHEHVKRDSGVTHVPAAPAKKPDPSPNDSLL